MLCLELMNQLKMVTILRTNGVDKIIILLLPLLDAARTRGIMSDSGINPEGSSKRRTRGRAKGIKHKPNAIRELMWDKLNCPIGKWKNDFSSYIGTLSRAKVSPKFKSWKLVSAGLKETLWLDVQREFRIPNDHFKKHIVIKNHYQRCFWILPSKQRADEVVIDNIKLNAMIKEQFALMLAAYGIDLPSEEPSVDARPVDDQLVDMIPPKSSCLSGGFDPFVGLKEITKCQLGWTIEGKQVIVGYGCANPELTETHNKKIVAAHVAVNVDGIEKKYESLEVPIPSDEIIVLGDAIGSYVQWPKVMVILEDKQGQWGKNKQNQSGNTTNEPVAPLRPFKPSKKSLAPEMRHQKFKNKKLNDCVNATNDSVACIKKPRHAHNPLPPHELSQKCKLLMSMLQAYSGDDTFSIKFEKSVFGLAKDGEIMLTKEDVNQLLTGAWISTSIVEVFIVVMQSEYTHLLQSVALMLPTSISSVSLEGTEELKSESFQYMTQVIQQNSSKRFIFCPYFEENHWILFVLCLAKREVYSFDSLTTSTSVTFKTFLNRAFVTYVATSIKRLSRTEFTWIDVECPQRKGSTKCGYFTMCNMLKLVKHNLESEGLPQAN